MQPSIVGEVLTLRHRHSKTYLLDNGQYMAIIGQRDMHYQDTAGNWHNIEAALVDEADFDAEEAGGRPVAAHIHPAFAARAAEVRAARAVGRGVNRDQTAWQVLRAPHQVVLPKNIKKGYSIGYGADPLRFVPVGASPSRGQISPNDPCTVEYQDVWAQVDMRLTVLPHGIKEVLVLKSLAAARTFSVEVDGQLADDLTGGALRVHQGSLRDSDGTERSVPVTKRVASGKVYLDITPDVTGLVAPIEIDPTVTYSGTANADDGYVSCFDPFTVGAWPPDPSGSGSVTAYPGSTTSTTFSVRSQPNNYGVGMVRIDTSAIPDSAIISGANLVMVCYQQANTNVRNLTGAWYSSAFWPIDSSDWVYWGYAGGAGYNTAFTYPLSSIAAGATATIPLTSPGNINKAGYTGLRLFIDGGAPTGENYARFYGYADTSHTEPRLVVTYNVPPGAPVLTVPNGGETWNTEHTITWTPATDPETAQGSLQYQVQLSTDNGTTWSDLVALTVAGATSVAVNLSAKPESSACFVRVRAYDGSAYGAWDQSDGAFTIAHNQAPLAPSSLSPSSGSVDRALVTRLSWQHNDLNSSDPQSKFDLQWSSDGGAIWNTVTQATPNQYWDAPGGTFPHGQVVWRVRTYDQGNLSGPYSAQATFFAGDKPAAPVFVDPVDGSTLAVSRPTVQWSSSSQIGYQLLATTLGDVIVWDSGDVTSTNKARTLGGDLANNTQYKLKARIRNADGVWSDYAVITISISYAPPGVPGLAVSPYPAGGRIQLTFSGQGAEVAYNDLYRRINGGEWIRIATDIAPNAVYDDYAAPSGASCDYQGDAVATNGVATASAIVTAILNLTGLWIHDVAAASTTAFRFTRNTSRRNGRRADVTSMKFAGRDLPMTEFGDTDEGAGAFSLLITDKAELDALWTLYGRKATLCFRDSSGRRLFGILPALEPEDQLGGYWTANLDVVENDHSEEV